MLNGKVMIIRLINRSMKKIYRWMSEWVSEYFPEQKFLRKMKVELNLLNYATKKN